MLSQKIDEYIEEIEKLKRERLAIIEENKKKVSSKNYIDWLYEFVSTNRHIDSNTGLLDYEGDILENARLLSDFFDYIKSLAFSQNIMIGPNARTHLDNKQATIKIRDKFFKISRICWPNYWISIDLLDEYYEDVFSMSWYDDKGVFIMVEPCENIK